MKKAILLSLICLLAGSALVGCGESSSSSAASDTGNAAVSEDETPAQNPEEAPAESSEEAAEAPLLDGDFSMPTELTDNLYDYRVMIGDEVLTIPVTLHHFTAAGWKNDTQYTKIGENGGNYSIDFKKDNMQITVNATNNTPELIDRLVEGADAGLDVMSLTCSARWNETEIKLPNGIILGKSTYDDLIAAYGKPSDADSYLYVYYEGDPVEKYFEKDAYITFTLGENDDGATVVQTVTMHHAK